MGKNYAVLENTLVVNVVVSDAQYAQQQGWVELVGDAGIGWTYVNGQFVAPAPIPPTPEEIQAQNKSKAETLLQSTDWTATVDINNPQFSNPYLGNQDAFLAYRSQVRQIAVNPPTIPAVFPEAPKEVWITV